MNNDDVNVLLIDNIAIQLLGKSRKHLSDSEKMIVALLINHGILILDDNDQVAFNEYKADNVLLGDNI